MNEIEPKKPGRKKHESIGLRKPHVKVYKFVSKFIDEKVYSPQINDIAKGTRTPYRTTIRYVSDLIALGYFVRDPGIKIIKDLV